VSTLLLAARATVRATAPRSVVRRDGGTATAAVVSQPCGLALDTTNNLYVSEVTGCRYVQAHREACQLNHTHSLLSCPLATPIDRIRVIFTNGTIRTIAGTSTCSFSGDNGPALQATLYQPHGIALTTSNRMYVADFSNNRIW